MILRCADGLANKAVAAELGVHEHTVGKWRRRFEKERLDGLSVKPRPGRPRSLECSIAWRDRDAAATRTSASPRDVSAVRWKDESG